MSYQDQSQYQLGLVNVGLDRLILVRIGLYLFGPINIGLDWLILVWID